MSRPPLARARVLEAARSLVLREGARSLSLESLARESRVTRGGILYHWPNRRALIRGLIEYDLDAWERRCTGRPPGGDFIAGHIRCSLDATDSVGMLAASLLPEAREDAATWESVRQNDLTRFRAWDWDDADVARYVLLLAAEGAFWRRMNGLVPDAPELDARVRRRIEHLLAEVAADGEIVRRQDRPGTPPCSENQTLSDERSVCGAPV